MEVKTQSREYPPGDSDDGITASLIHRKEKDGGCAFYRNTLRTKLSPLGI